MNVLLVDDEQPIRDYLRTLVDWKGLGYELHEAENGKIAIELMKRIHVDVLLLDITMPVVNGLEVHEWISQNNYSCVTTFLTSHDEFEYAQKALRTGCFDYVLKTDVTSESIIALIERMVGALSVETQQNIKYAQLETAAQRKEQTERQAHVRFLLESDDDYGLKKLFEDALGFKEGVNRFSMIAFKIHDYAEIVNRYTKNDIVQFSVIFDGVISELLEQFKYYYTAFDDGLFTLFLCFPKALSVPLIEKQIRELTISIDAAFRNILKIKTTIIYSLPFLQISASCNYFKKVPSLLSLDFYEAWSIGEFSQFNYNIEQINEQMTLFTQNIVNAIKERSITKTEAAFDNALLEINNRKLVISPQIFLSICEKTVSEAGGQLKLHEQLNVAKQELLEAVQPICIPNEVEDKNFLVKKAVLLIQQHYKEDIGLEWLATQLWVNSSYLSRLFSQETGQPFTQYLNNYRIEKAKEIIGKTNLKLYEIAESVGFSSAIVFSNVFKKITGETPSEYKKHFI